MHKKYLLLGLILIPSLNVHADSLNINKNTVVYIGDDKIYVRKEPKEESLKLGVLEGNQSVSCTGKFDGDYMEVTSGDITGWVLNSDDLVSGSALKSHVLNNLYDFDVRVQACTPTGIYADEASIGVDTLKYNTWATIRDSDRNVNIYKTSTLGRYIDGLTYFDDYVDVVSNKAIVFNKKDKKVGVAKEGSDFKLLGDKGDLYKIKYSGVASYIPKDSCIVTDKAIKASNIADVDFENNTMYEIELLENNIAKITIDYDDYYMSVDDLYIFYTIDNGSLAFSVASGDKTYPLSKIVKKGKYYQINITNNISKTELPAYVTSDDCNLLVNFEDCSSYAETFDFESLLSDSVYKDKYNYEYDNSSTDERNEIVNYALTFLGNPYVYGGTSLNNGIDCSAYCMRVLQHFGKNITRTTATQVKDQYGRLINADELQPGDLIYYTHNGVDPYHVVMYLGGDKCVNASCRKYGICISTIKTDSILCIKNYID